MKKASERCPDYIAHHSKKRLTLQERNALRFGLNNPILSKKVQKEKIKTNIEKLTYTIKRNTDITMNEDTKDDIKFLVNRFTDDANRVCSERSNQSLHKLSKLYILRKLSNDPLIKVCKSKKGNGVAILESEDYCAKLDKIVNDKTKFVEIRQDTETYLLRK